MTVWQARETARQWVVDEASVLPGFRGAYTAGSTNWLPDDAALPASSDLDVMIVVAGPNHASTRGKFRYGNVLLEASFLGEEQFRTPDAVLSDYHLAPSLRTAHILLDPSCRLAALREIVCREYAKRQWVRRRCAAAQDRVVRHLGAMDETLPLHDQAIAFLFGTGVTTHVLLVAGLTNPTVRARYVAVRELLAAYDCLDLHEELLELLGAARISPAEARRHLAALEDVFDAAATAIHSPLPFASDIGGIARPIAIDGARQWIERGYHREAMFWIAVTHSRCRKVLSTDAAGELPRRFAGSYRDLLSSLGVASSAALLQRRAAVEHFLPRLSEAAERIVAANPAIV